MAERKRVARNVIVFVAITVGAVTGAVSLPGLGTGALVGLVWSAWHAPYWVGLLNQASLQDFRWLGLPAFIVLGVVALLTSSVLYGELKLATR